MKRIADIKINGAVVTDERKSKKQQLANYVFVKISSDFYELKVGRLSGSDFYSNENILYFLNNEDQVLVQDGKDWITNF